MAGRRSDHEESRLSTAYRVLYAQGSISLTLVTELGRLATRRPLFTVRYVLTTPLILAWHTSRSLCLPAGRVIQTRLSQMHSEFSTVPSRTKAPSTSQPQRRRDANE